MTERKSELKGHRDKSGQRHRDDATRAESMGGSLVDQGRTAADPMSLAAHPLPFPPRPRDLAAPHTPSRSLSSSALPRHSPIIAPFPFRPFPLVLAIYLSCPNTHPHILTHPMHCPDPVTSRARPQHVLVTSCPILPVPFMLSCLLLSHALLQSDLIPPSPQTSAWCPISSRPVSLPIKLSAPAHSHSLPHG